MTVMIYALAVGILTMVIGGFLVYGVRMPGNSFRGVPPALVDSEDPEGSNPQLFSTSKRAPHSMHD